MEPVDLGRLPVPGHAPLDGGPFINGGVVIGRDPVSGRQNLSYVRLQVKDRRPHRRQPEPVATPARVLRDRRGARRANLPFYVALGVDPVLMIAAEFRYDGDEYEIAGALRGRPIGPCARSTCDLLVPATAEIVSSARFLAHEREEEGPMAEYTGHYSGVAKQCVGHVKAITHRRHPIFETIAGASFEHLLLGTAVTREPKLKQLALAASPRVRDVLLPPYASGFLARIAMDKPKPGEPRNVAIAALNSHVNISVVVVDADVNIFSPTDVLWALSTRVRWDRDVSVIAGTLGNDCTRRPMTTRRDREGARRRDARAGAARARTARSSIRR